MAGGLVGLLDDVAALAKLAAASVDDVGVAAGRASMKAAGVVVDDAAVTPAYVRGLAAEREIPIIKKIAFGSLRNKLLFITPVALLLSAIAPTLVEVILMFGGSFLAYEGAHKLAHAIHKRRHPESAEHAAEAAPSAALGPEAEAKTVSGAVRTDFILSAEIMVIALKEVLDEPIVARAAILAVVAVVITVAVYGVVGLIVRMDDVGLKLVEKPSESSQRMGRLLVNGMHKLLAVLSVVGTAAMLWVGGHILLVGADELGWHAPYDLVHDLEHHVEDIAAVGGVLAWIVNTLASAVVGLVVGTVIHQVVKRIPRPKKDSADPAAAAAH
jgi:predicted DNA repair protein MutK